MELKDFVKTTLEQIVEGVVNAQDSIESHGASINPSTLRFTKEGHKNHFEHPMPQDVVFDVGLTSTDNSGSSAGIGVFLGGISLGQKNDTGAESVAVTKVKFTVPLVLPPGKDMKVPRKALKIQG